MSQTGLYLQYLHLSFPNIITWAGISSSLGPRLLDDNGQHPHRFPSPVSTKASGNFSLNNVTLFKLNVPYAFAKASENINFSSDHVTMSKVWVSISHLYLDFQRTYGRLPCRDFPKTVGCSFRCLGCVVSFCWAIWQFGNLAIWQFGNLVISQFGNLAIWQYGNLAICKDWHLVECGTPLRSRPSGTMRVKAEWKKASNIMFHKGRKK